MKYINNRVKEAKNSTVCIIYNYLKKIKSWIFIVFNKIAINNNK